MTAAVLDESTLRGINAARRVGVGVGVYGWSPGRGGVHHHRIAEPLRVLADLGGNAYHGPMLTDDILSNVDTVLVHTLHGEKESEAWEDLAALGTHRMVYDVDDWMWGPDWLPFRQHYTPDVLARLFRNVALAHVVTTPSEPIAEYLSRHNPNVHVVHNTVPSWLLDHQRPELAAPTIGWQCSDSHKPDFTHDVINGLGAFMGRHQNWHIHAYGPWGIQPGPGIAADRIHQTQWIPTVADYYRALNLTIGLGPARNTAFNRGKSALRAIEYAALGIVAVLPDLPIYRGWVENGHTGRLIRRSNKPARTLAGILGELAADPAGLARMSTTARGRAAGWTTEANIGRWVDAWQTV